MQLKLSKTVKWAEINHEQSNYLFMNKIKPNPFAAVHVYIFKN